MVYQYVPYIWLLIISSVITFFLGVIVLFGQRKSKRAYYFVVSMFTLTLWSLPNALEMMAVTLQTKLFWGNVQYIAYCYSPLMLVALCMDFTDNDRFLKNKKLIWFTILPTIIILLVWTNNYHGLIRYDVQLDESGPMSIIAKKYGIAFYIHAAYSYLLNITAVVVLIRALFIKKSIYFKQTVILLIGSCFIIIPNMIYVFGLSPFQSDITPVFFGPAGLIIMWAIFRYKLFELVPLARTTVIETMNLGVMVLDLTDKVIDMNPAFLRIMDLSSSQFYDVSIEKVCNNIPELVEAYKKGVVNFDFTVKHPDQSYIYEVLFTPLRDKKGKLLGKMAVVYEVTDKKQAQLEFLKHQRALASMEEKERMARDLHDNLGQLLGFLNMQAQGINQELHNAGIDLVSGKLEQLVKVTQVAHSEIRDYIREVRTSVNQEQDFAGEIKKIINLFEFQTGIRVDLDIDCNILGEVIKTNIRIHLLNIIKEALNNIRKHAEARRVIVALRVTDGQLQVSVSDDGKGFRNTTTGSSNKGFGLSIIQERAHTIGGQIQIQSEIGKGTQVILSIPLEKEGIQDADKADVG